MRPFRNRFGERAPESCVKSLRLSQEMQATFITIQFADGGEMFRFNVWNVHQDLSPDKEDVQQIAQDDVKKQYVRQRFPEQMMQKDRFKEKLTRRILEYVSPCDKVNLKHQSPNKSQRNR